MVCQLVIYWMFADVTFEIGTRQLGIMCMETVIEAWTSTSWRVRRCRESHLQSLITTFELLLSPALTLV